MYFASNPTISTFALGQYFKNRINLALAAVEGSVNNSSPPFAIPSPAPYIQSVPGISNPYDCN
ncbi:hypothetical protein N7U66_18870 [Lacinutrix neustonica]|uniref:Uncharacterized protein n=1 Tax=Lacinutrix neustonica TaxID=2980107 RepID=A0A9E8SGN2_9FLAO|nr:hypothetical protein [Lacinutrix neustonica]WAC01895.1 hypothetical protein N7U66_18870 [Lacinutrix neustonica]